MALTMMLIYTEPYLELFIAWCFIPTPYIYFSNKWVSGKYFEISFLWRLHQTKELEQNEIEFTFRLKPCCSYKMIERYKGIPKVILNGNVTTNAMGKKIPGLALGAAIFMAAGTAI